MRKKSLKSSKRTNEYRVSSPTIRVNNVFFLAIAFSAERHALKELPNDWGEEYLVI
jgi:hypothetical protein